MVPDPVYVSHDFCGKNIQLQNVKAKTTNLTVMSCQHKPNASIGCRKIKKPIKNRNPMHPKYKLLKALKELAKQKKKSNNDAHATNAHATDTCATDAHASNNQPY